MASPASCQHCHPPNPHIPPALVKYPVKAAQLLLAWHVPTYVCTRNACLAHLEILWNMRISSDAAPAEDATDQQRHAVVMTTTTGVARRWMDIAKYHRCLSSRLGRRVASAVLTTAPHSNYIISCQNTQNPATFRQLGFAEDWSYDEGVCRRAWSLVDHKCDLGRSSILNIAIWSEPTIFAQFLPAFLVNSFEDAFAPKRPG